MRVEHKVVIGAIFRSSAVQEVRDLFLAFGKLGTPEIHLRIAISDVDRAAGEQLASKLNLTSRVSFDVPPDDIVPLLDSLSFLVLPCYSGSVPVAVLEAMAAGLPVITSSTVRLQLIANHGGGIVLAPPGDVTELVRAIEDLISNPEKQQSLGSQARTYAKRMHGGSLFAGRATYGYEKHPAPSKLRQMLKGFLFSLIPTDQLLWKEKSVRSEFALTFDDGPDPVYTEQILEILRAKKVKSTFFLVGNRAEEHPDLVRRIDAEGHELANHCYTHVQLRHCSTRQALDEVRHTGEILESISGKRCQLFRPPFGYVSRQCMAAALLERQQVVMWSIDPKDYSAESPAQIEEIFSKRHVQNGDIILYHGTNQAAISALPAVIESAQFGGRSGVTVSALRHR
jgi:peptidoglycan/xylan/chitin deacetylase (PgdA/CDA1 family)